MSCRGITPSEQLCLEPCPFCRTKDLLDYEQSDRTRGYMAIVCRHCGCVGPIRSSKDIKVATAMWNELLKGMK